MTPIPKPFAEPWEADEVMNFSGTLVSVITSGRLMLAQTRPSDDEATKEEVQEMANKMAAAPELLKELLDADELICELCKRLNPQHISSDYGKGCNWCEEREDRLQALGKALS